MRLSGRLGFSPSGDWDSGNPAFAISRGSPGTPPCTPQQWLPVSWHAVFPVHLSDHGSAIRSKDTSSSPCPLRGLYSSAPRGARRSSSYALRIAKSRRLRTAQIDRRFARDIPRTGKGYRLPASGGRVAAGEHFRVTGDRESRRSGGDRGAMRGATAPWRPGGQRRGGRWAAAGHPGAGPAGRAACDPGAFSGTVRL